MLIAEVIFILVVGSYCLVYFTIPIVALLQHTRIGLWLLILYFLIPLLISVVSPPLTPEQRERIDQRTRPAVVSSQRV